jgi:hypothetical protein
VQGYEKLSKDSKKIIQHVGESVRAGAAIWVVLKAVQYFVNEETAHVMQNISDNFANHHKDYPVGLGLVGLLAVGAAFVMYANEWWSKNIARWGVYPVFDFISHVSAISAGFIAVVLIMKGQIVESLLTFLIFAPIALISAFTAHGFRYGSDTLFVAAAEPDKSAEVRRNDSWKAKVFPIVGIALFPLVVSLLNYAGKMVH